MDINIRLMQTSQLIMLLLSIGIVYWGVFKASHRGWQSPYFLSISYLIIVAIGCFNILLTFNSAMAPFETDLIIQGASAQSTNDLLSAMNGSNTALLKDLRGVRSDDFIRFTLLNDPDTTGVYFISEQTIYLKRNAESQYNFQHELHHHLWYSRMNDSQHKEFELISTRSDPPTEYARTSVEEDFAETGANYIIGNQSLLDANRLNFMNELYDDMLSK